MANGFFARPFSRCFLKESILSWNFKKLIVKNELEFRPSRRIGILFIVIGIILFSFYNIDDFLVGIGYILIVLGLTVFFILSRYAIPVDSKDDLKKIKNGLTIMIIGSALLILSYRLCSINDILCFCSSIIGTSMIAIGLIIYPEKYKKV